MISGTEEDLGSPVLKSIAEKEAQLAAATEPRQIVDALNALGEDILYHDYERALDLVQQAQEQAKACAYTAGQATSELLWVISMRSLGIMTRP